MDAYRSYEDYDRSAAFYDETRAAVGVEIILGVLASGPRPLDRQRVLDVGCGTGNYVAALRRHVGQIFGLEYNPGMLAQARRKAAPAGSAGLIRGTAFSLPLADGDADDASAMDAVMLNQVIHHFDDGGEGGDDAADFPRLALALSEAFRVLRPGGVLILNHCTQRQVREAYWWGALIPQAMTAMARRYASIPVLRALLDGAGFTGVKSAVPIDDVLQAGDYLNLRGPLSETWRRGDSTWTLAADTEREAGLSWLRQMLDDGTAAAFLAEREALRREIGQSIAVWGRRP